MSPPPDVDREPITTSGVIAVPNLHAQIEGLAAAVVRTAPGPGSSPMVVGEWAVLIDLLILRGHVLGRIADYEQAQELAEVLVGHLPSEPAGWLARARTRGSLHRFAEAKADLGRAEFAGLDRRTLDTEHAVVHQALGERDRARALYERAGARDKAQARSPDFTALAALAVLHSESGELVEAERLFGEARRRYQGTSPFPIASLDFRRAQMWLKERDAATGYAWLEASRRRVPGYAPVLARLAEVDVARGDHEIAINRLKPLAASSDDPAYAAALSRALRAAGDLHDAEQHRAVAATRYEQLALRHPQAYADHAADFQRSLLSLHHP